MYSVTFLLCWWADVHVQNMRNDACNGKETLSFIPASRIFLGVERNVIEVGPPQFQPKQGARYQPPSLPQLIFHFSSRAHRMRDVSISCQSFPGLCVTCVVISVWLTGSVVSHCPAPSDSGRLTLMMRGRRGVLCSGTAGETTAAKILYTHICDKQKAGNKHKTEDTMKEQEGSQGFTIYFLFLLNMTSAGFNLNGLICNISHIILSKIKSVRCECFL